MNNENSAQKFIEIISTSKYAVAFTGAGISTESGIPDYRSPGTGVWDKMDPDVVSLDGFHRNPGNYYKYALDMYEIRSKAEPNPAHYLLADLEEKGLLKGVITQNVDSLHHQAGSKQVYELHGSLREAVCLNCSSTFPMDGLMERARGGEIPPTCENCNGKHLKPRAVFFGEALPQDTWNNAMELSQNSDLLIVIGSSLQVSPANSLPAEVLRNGGKLVIINLMATQYDDRAHVLINERVGEFALLARDLLKTLSI